MPASAPQAVLAAKDGGGKVRWAGAGKRRTGRCLWEMATGAASSAIGSSLWGRPLTPMPRVSRLAGALNPLW